MRLTKLYALSLLLASMAAVIIPSAGAQDRLFSNEAKQKAAALLKQMTLDEKVGQLNESSGIVMPGVGTEKPDDLIANGGVGSILWQMNVKEINRLQHIAMEKSRLHIPIIFGFDVIHGYRTVFPVPLAMASSWDPSVEEQAQHLAAEDARAARKSSGPSLPWSILHATLAGAESWRVLEKIPSWAPRWRALRFADSRARSSGQTVSWSA
jgi:beta-glucosidase